MFNTTVNGRGKLCAVDVTRVPDSRGGARGVGDYTGIQRKLATEKQI
jgi:hypothetical protein